MSQVNVVSSSKPFVRKFMVLTLLQLSIVGVLLFQIDKFEKEGALSYKIAFSGILVLSQIIFVLIYSKFLDLENRFRTTFPGVHDPTRGWVFYFFYFPILALPTIFCMVLGKSVRSVHLQKRHFNALLIAMFLAQFLFLPLLYFFPYKALFWSHTSVSQPGVQYLSNSVYEVEKIKGIRDELTSALNGRDFNAGLYRKHSSALWVSISVLSACDKLMRNRSLKAEKKLEILLEFSELYSSSRSIIFNLNPVSYILPFAFFEATLLNLAENILEIKSLLKLADTFDKILKNELKENSEKGEHLRHLQNSFNKLKFINEVRNFKILH